MNRRRAWAYAKRQRWWIAAAVCVLAFAANVLAADQHGVFSWIADGTVVLEFAALAWAIGLDGKRPR